jgi:hypothetical protein
VRQGERGQCHVLDEGPSHGVVGGTARGNRVKRDGGREEKASKVASKWTDRQDGRPDLIRWQCFPDLGARIRSFTHDPQLSSATVTISEEAPNVAHPMWQR